MQLREICYRNEEDGAGSYRFETNGLRRRVEGIRPQGADEAFPQSWVRRTSRSGDNDRRRGEGRRETLRNLDSPGGASELARMKVRRAAHPDILIIPRTSSCN